MNIRKIINIHEGMGSCRKLKSNPAGEFRLSEKESLTENDVVPNTEFDRTEVVKHNSPVINFRAVPSEIKLKDNWNVWKAVYEDNGKMRKVPCKPDGSGKLKWSDTKNLMTFQRAIETYLKGLKNDIKFDGIGFILPSDSDLVVIDLDDAFEADGSLKSATKIIIEHFGSYAEISPSGKGIHIWLKAKQIGSNISQIVVENQSVSVYA